MCQIQRLSDKILVYTSILNLNVKIMFIAERYTRFLTITPQIIRVSMNLTEKIIFALATSLEVSNYFSGKHIWITLLLSSVFPPYVIKLIWCLIDRKKSDFTNKNWTPNRFKQIFKNKIASANKNIILYSNVTVLWHVSVCESLSCECVIELIQGWKFFHRF